MIGSVALATLSSALNTQARATQTAAANIANVLTPNYQSQRGQPVALAPSGVGYAVAPPLGEVDLGREAVDLTVSRQAFAAAAKAYSSIDDTERKALSQIA